MTLYPDEKTPVVPTFYDGTGESLDARFAVAQTARNEIGHQDPDKYWAVVQPLLMGNPHGISWCGGFALWCLRMVKLCDWQWEIWSGPGSKSGFLFRLKPTTRPLPGDIAYFNRAQHHAIVERVENGQVFTIDGNTLRFPEEGVTANQRPVSAVSAFYSIASLVGE